MKAIEFIFEDKGQRIFGRWPQMSQLIAKGVQTQRSLDNARVKDDDYLKEIAQQLISIDPTRTGLYEPTIVKWFGNGEFFINEDEPKVTSTLQDYHTLKSRKKLPPEVTDINRLTFDQVSTTVDEIMKADKIAALQVQREKQNSVANASGEEIKPQKDRGELIIQDGVFEVYVPHTKEQARVCSTFPSNSLHGQTASAMGTEANYTKFCTLSSDMFDNYSKDGPLYNIIINDGNPETMRVFQLHYESNQLMNERDASVSKQEIALLSKYPGYTKLLNMLIKKHYGEFLTK